MLLLVNLLILLILHLICLKKIVFRKHFALFSVAMISKKIQNDHIGLQLI